MVLEMVNKKLLTVPALSLYIDDAITIRADSGLREDAERGFLVSGQFKPEYLSAVRLGAVLIDRSNTRAFLLPWKIRKRLRIAKTIRRCHMAQEHPGDRLNVCASKLAFITDALTQDKVFVFRLSEEGTAGLYYILSGIEKELREISTEVD
jgi:hypothetical protein